MKKKLITLVYITFIILFTYFTIAINSDTISINEWKMVGRTLNHTSFDGTTFSKIDGLHNVNFTTTLYIDSSPAVANGYVYFGGTDYLFYQLNASNISQQIANYTTGSYIDSSPAVANGYVYFGSYDHIFYQLNASNVSQKINTFTAGSYFQITSPVIYNDSVYVGNHDKNVYQLNATNVSQLIATFTTGHFVYGSPAVAGGNVYIGSYDKNVYQLNASNISQKIANYTTGYYVQSSPTVYNDSLYIGSDDNKVYQLNASNVSQLISTFTTAGEVWSIPAVANGYVYIGSEDNTFYQLNASDISQQIANYTTGNSIYGSPSVANGYVYIGSYDNVLYKLNATNVTKYIENYTTGSIIYGIPAVANGYVYVSSNDNVLYQLNANNFSLINDFTHPIITIASPLNQNYGNNMSINLNFSSVDNILITSCNYSVINSTGGEVIIADTSIPITSGVCENTTFNLTEIEEDYNLTICSNDSSNNWACSKVTFGIRMNYPNIVLNYPADNQFFNNGFDIYFNFTASRDIGVDTCELYSNWTGWHSNYTWVYPTNFTMNYTKINVSEGKYIWNVKCNDTLNNAGWALRNLTVTVDTIKPNIVINAISTTIGYQTVAITSTETDANLDTCKYSIYNSTNGIDGLNSNITFTCNVPFTATVTDFGTFNFSIYTNDSAGNYNHSSKFFTVYATSPGSLPSGGSKTEVIIINKSRCGDLICQHPNDFGQNEDYWSCSTDCPGAVGENLDLLVAGLTTYCFDKDNSSTCLWTQMFSGVNLEGNFTISSNVPLNIDTTLNCFKGKSEECYWNTQIGSLIILGVFILVFIIATAKVIPTSKGSNTRESLPKYIAVSAKKYKRKKR